MPNPEGEGHVPTLEQLQNNYDRMNIDRRTTQPDIYKLLAAPPICATLMSYCDLKDRAALRKASSIFRNTVETSRLHLKLLCIAAFGKHRHLITENLHIAYFPDEKTMKVENVTSGRVRSVDYSGENRFEVFQRDLTTILNLERLEIERMEHCCHLLPGMVDDLSVVRQNQKQLLRVRQFETSDLRGLRFLDSKFLDRILYVDSDNLRFTEIDEIAKMKQWKNAKELVTDQAFRTGNFVENFGHFDYLDYLVQEGNDVTMEEVVELKNTLLRRPPTLQKIEIIATADHDHLDPLFLKAPDSFQPFQDPHDEKWYHFKYPNSSPEKMLSVRIAYTGILFKGPCFMGNKIKIEDRRFSMHY